MNPESVEVVEPLTFTPADHTTLLTPLDACSESEVVGRFKDETFRYVEYTPEGRLSRGGKYLIMKYGMARHKPFWAYFNETQLWLSRDNELYYRIQIIPIVDYLPRILAAYFGNSKTLSLQNIGTLKHIKDTVPGPGVHLWTVRYHNITVGVHIMDDRSGMTVTALADWQSPLQGTEFNNQFIQERLDVVFSKDVDFSTWLM